MRRADRHRLRIAMIGQRGVPARVGGVEHHVEELGARLSDRGHEVIVYCRTNYTDERHVNYRGMTPRYRDTINTKHFDAIAHSATSSLSAIRAQVDIVHYHAMGPGLVAPLPAMFSGAKVVQTIHGLDQNRGKWGSVASGVLNLGSWMSSRVPAATIVVSRALQEHYRSHYNRETHYIPNGVNVRAGYPADKSIAQYGLTPGGYVLFVGRLVPEKAPDMLMRAFRQIPGDLKLVIVGGTSFSDEYVRSLEDIAAQDPRIVMPGYLHGAALDEMYANARIFALPSAVEGLPLTLLEAAAHGVPILASDIPPHGEVLGADAPGRRFFRVGDEHDLRRRLMVMLADREAEAAGGREGPIWVHQRYNWDAAADQLAAVYEDVADGRRLGRPAVIDLTDGATRSRSAMTKARAKISLVSAAAQGSDCDSSPGCSGEADCRCALSASVVDLQARQSSLLG